MLSESEASAFPTGYEKADSSAVPQNNILRQYLTGEAKDSGVEVFRMVQHFYLNPSRLKGKEIETGSKL